MLGAVVGAPILAEIGVFLNNGTAPSAQYVSSGQGLAVRYSEIVPLTHKQDKLPVVDNQKVIQSSILARIFIRTLYRGLFIRKP